MKRKTKIRLKNINALLIVTVIIISVGVAAFAGMTVMNTDFLAQYTSRIYEEPFSANNAAWRMRLEILYARNTMLTLLNGGKENAKIQQEALEKMYQYRQEQNDIKDTLFSQYPGDKAVLEQLYQDFDEIQSLHDKAVILIDQGREEEARSLLYDEAYPLYLESEQMIQEIIDDSQNRIDFYVEQSQMLNARTNLMAIVWGSILIVLTLLISILSVRTISRRNSDIYHNDMLFGIISENVDDVFMVYDCINEKVEYISENAERILGFRAADLKKNLAITKDYLSDGWFEKVRDKFAYSTSSQVIEMEYQMLDPHSGNARELVSKMYPLVENGELIKHIFVTSDLTSAKKTQSMLRTALENSENANLAKREFLSRMSHEIRTPMNAIIGMVYIMGYSLDDAAKTAEGLKKINSAAHHLLDLINDILDMSKIESGKLTIEKSEFSLNELLSDISMIVQPRMEEKRQLFDVMLREVEQDELVGDALRIKQVLLNFLTNAHKFTPEGGKIKLAINQIARRDNAVCLHFAVSDTGIGMNDEFMERIFQPFEQEDVSTSRRFGGTGLGLALCKTLVETMGGTISVESAVGQGSKFAFDLWLDISTGGEKVKKNAAKMRALHVLLVDDDEGMCEHLKVICEQLGMATETVSSGAEAVHAVKTAQVPFDLCFVDLYMPDVDGIRTAEWLRSEAKNDMYIVLMSDYDYKRVQKEAREAGVNGLLSKPVLQGDICRIVADMQGTLQEEKAAPPEEIFDFSGKRMLLVEDNELNREISTELAEHVNFAVEWAENGKEAVEKFEASPPGYYDVILMDIQLPVMDGYEATRRIRRGAHADAEKVLIVAMTANGFKEDVAESVRNGMNAHIAKPIDARLLFATLRDFLL